MAPKFVGIDEVCEMASISNSTLNYHRKNPKSKSPFPAPDRTTGKFSSPQWKLSTVNAWVKQPRKHGPAAATKA